MSIQFRINGRKTTRAKAAAYYAHAEADVIGPGHVKACFDHFDAACEQSSDGYAWRDVVEETGVSIRHKGEEGFTP